MSQDLTYSKNLLKRINSVIIEGTPIHAYFQKYYNGKAHSFWASQQFFLFSEIKSFSIHKDFEKYKKLAHVRKLHSYVTDIVLHIIALFSSLYSVIVLRFGNTAVLTYSVDKLKKDTRHDPRLIEIYRILEEQGILYREVVHTLLGKEFLINLFRRRKLPLYLKSIDIFYTFFKDSSKEKKYLEDVNSLGLDEFEEFEKPFVQQLLKAYARKCLGSEFRIEILEKIFKNGSLTTFISIDDSRYGNELLLACHLTGIASHIFQHSNFDYLQDLDTLPPSVYAFPNTFYLWNEYWKTYIAEKSPLFKFYEDRLHVGGRTDGFTFQSPLLKELKSDKLKVLVSYEMNVDKEEIARFVHNILNCKEVVVIFKVRTDVDFNEQIAEYGISDDVQNKKIKATTILTEKILKDIDVVVGVYTTLLEGMIERGKSVLVLKTLHPVFHDLSGNNLAMSVDIMDPNICIKLNEAASIPHDTLLKRRATLIEGTSNIKETIESILKNCVVKK